MRRVANHSGTSYQFKIDPISVARLQYLNAFYARVFGLKTSSSAIVRLSLKLLTDQVEELVKKGRSVPDPLNPPSDWNTLTDNEVDTYLSFGRAAYQMQRAKEGENFIEREGLPTLSDIEPFPTWNELQGRYKDKRTTIERLQEIGWSDLEMVQ